MENREEILIAQYPCLAKAGQYGIDIVMLYDNVQRPVIEGIRRHQIALDALQKLKNTANTSKMDGSRK
jgi:hypothetical protein